MPLSALAEAVLQPVIELVIQVVGYVTARIIVPVFTIGQVHVEAIPNKKPVIPKYGRIQRIDGELIMDAEMGAFVGFVFWICVGLYFFFQK